MSTSLDPDQDYQYSVGSDLGEPGPNCLQSLVAAEMTKNPFQPVPLFKAFSYIKDMALAFCIVLVLAE